MTATQLVPIGTVVYDGTPHAHMSAGVRAESCDCETRTTIRDLKGALLGALHHLERPNQVVPANRYRAWRDLAGMEPLADGTPFDRALDGTNRAAAKWTADELAAVDKAIVTVATDAQAVRLGLEPATFTADHIWDELGPGFLVTKGLTGRLVAAKNRGTIRNTGRVTHSARDGEHGHGQRLTVWAPVHGTV